MILENSMAKIPFNAPVITLSELFGLDDHLLKDLLRAIFLNL